MSVCLTVLQWMLLIVLCWWYLNLIVARRCIRPLDCSSLPIAQNSLVGRLHRHHRLIEIDPNIDALIVQYPLGVHLLLLHELLVLTLDFFSVVRALQQRSIQKAIVVLLLQFLFWGSIVLLYCLITQCLMRNALALEGICWCNSLVLSCMRDLWSLAVHWFLYLIWIMDGILLSSLFEFIWICVTNWHLLALSIVHLLLILWLLLVHIQRIIRMLAHLRRILIRPWIRLLMPVRWILIILGGRAPEVSRRLMWVLDDIVIHSSTVIVLKGIDAYYPCSWGRQYDPTWRISLGLLMVMAWIYWVAIFTHRTVLLWEIFCVWLYYFTSSFVTLVEFHFVVWWKVLLALSILSRNICLLDVCVWLSVWLGYLPLRWCVAQWQASFSTSRAFDSNILHVGNTVPSIMHLRIVNLLPSRRMIVARLALDSHSRHRALRLAKILMRLTLLHIFVVNVACACYKNEKRWIRVFQFKILNFWSDI